MLLPIQHSRHCSLPSETGGFILPLASLRHAPLCLAEQRRKPALNRQKVTVLAQQAVSERTEIDTDTLGADFCGGRRCSHLLSSLYLTYSEGQQHCKSTHGC